MLDTNKLDLNNVEATEAAAQKAWMRVDMQNKKVVPTTGYAVAISPIDGKVWVPVPQVDGPQNKIYSLDPKTHEYKDYLLPVPLPVPHALDFPPNATSWLPPARAHLHRSNPTTP